MQFATAFMNTWLSGPIHKSKLLWFVLLIGLGIAGNI